MQLILLLICLIQECPSTKQIDIEPCTQDFSLLTEKAMIELSLACSTIDGAYSKRLKSERLEIWKNGKRI